MDTEPLDRELAADSVVDRRHFVGIIVYLVVSAALAAPLAFRDAPTWIQLTFSTALLLGFLVIARVNVRRVARFDEFQQMIAWRALAKAGLITVWFELFTGTAILAVRHFLWPDFADLFVVIALGPPEFWLLAALFIRGAERAYGTASAARPA